MIVILFSVGYNIEKSVSQMSTIEMYKDKISELYFSVGNFANGRGSRCIDSLLEYEKQVIQIENIKHLSSMGLGFNLLLNGNCYGKDSQSRKFFCSIGDTIDYLNSICNLACVTTTSPLIAKFIKNNFEHIEVRASVNMEIGNVEGMDYIIDYFDSFYLKREFNRDLHKITQARKWCDENGKKLYGLANSGCLNFCSTHIFHDNLVSHENEISQMDNAYQFEGQCWEYLKKDSKRDDWLRLTNFIRPEDVYLYENLFDGLKLATRINKNPSKIIESYCNASYNGAITELLEPSHTNVFFPCVIDNKKIASDFTYKVLRCSKNCDSCNFCGEIQKSATVSLE